LDQIGGVISFKLQYDEKTGKSMGYGFCEFRDKEHAELAREKLNHQDFMGRKLIVGKRHGKKPFNTNPFIFTHFYIYYCFFDFYPFFFFLFFFFFFLNFLLIFFYFYR
jgi:RNA recognition motif-containing protein